MLLFLTKTQKDYILPYYNSAMRGGNFAQARNSKQDMENIAAKMK